jgi:hypothetical protein
LLEYARQQTSAAASSASFDVAEVNNITPATTAMGYWKSEDLYCWA